MEEMDRWNEVERKSTAVKTRHNFYRQTKVTSLVREEQSALPAGVLNTYEGTTDEEAFFFASRRRSRKSCRRCARRSSG